MNDAPSSPDGQSTDNRAHPALQAVPIQERSEFKTNVNQDSFQKTGVTLTLALLSWPFRKVAHIVEWLFGVASMIGLLTICAAIPILQFVALGYLLEISTRIVQRQKVREGFVGIHRAARIGGFVLGTALVWLPAYNVSGIYHDAHILLADADELRPFGINLSIVILLTSIYTIWPGFAEANFAISCGPLLCFKSVLRRDLYLQTIEGFWIFVTSLHLKELFLLGFRGFIGTAAIISSSAFMYRRHTITGRTTRTRNSIRFALLALVLIYLPIMQTRYAVERRFSIFAEIKETRAVFKRAPIAGLHAFSVGICPACLSGENSINA